MTEGGRNLVWQAVADAIRGAEARGEIRAGMPWEPGQPDDNTITQEVIDNISADVSAGIEARIAVLEGSGNSPKKGLRPTWMQVLSGGKDDDADTDRAGDAGAGGDESAKRVVRTIRAVREDEAGIAKGGTGTVDPGGSGPGAERRDSPATDGGGDRGEADDPPGADERAGDVDQSTEPGTKG